MINRRTFLQNTLAIGGASLLSQLPTDSWANITSKTVKITILHTNDVHSRLEALPKSDPKYGGKGGVVNRAKLISKIRTEADHVLLFDAGDIFQGTPYFNLFKGKPEIELMSMMGYDAVTMGNHDFDGGLDLYAEQIQKYGKFSVLTANYDFSKTTFKTLTEPYKIFKINGVRIGVFGLGISPDGLIPTHLFGGINYLEPYQIANDTAAILKNDKKCALVVCLSHLGYNMGKNEPCDTALATQSKNIDLIIGGHTHTFLKEPTVLQNADKQPILVNQAGWGGINLGRLDFTFDRVSKKLFFEAGNVPIG
jgi:5'-nucleotidase